MSKIVLVLVSVAFLILLNGSTVVQAEDMLEGSTVTSEAAESTNVGNKICPVSGEKINEDTKATYEYEGKTYNFCCPMCIEEFKKDPEKYIKKVEEELQAEYKERAEEEHDMNMMQPDETSHQEQGIHSGHHH